MKGTQKLIRRCIGISSLSMILILILNVVLLASVSLSLTSAKGPWTAAGETAAALRQEENGYVLSKEMEAELRSEGAWAVCIDEQTMDVKWHTKNLPETIPLSYTASGIADLARGYVDGYPAYTSQSENGLVVLGYPKKRYWKHMYPSWDYDLIKNIPYLFLAVLGINFAAVFLIYIIANARLSGSIKPIAEGIEILPSGEPLNIREKGLLSGLAAGLNQTSQILQAQRQELRKKETARADWISGVSHDIRTPLSMVMGYAGQLEESPALPEKDRKKAEIIRRQSMKMKNLINDLNLASRLEYSMQPLSPQPVSLCAIARQSAADFINSDPEEKYQVELELPDDAGACRMSGDKELLLRAVRNLLENSRSHNPQGCHIKIFVKSSAAIFTRESMQPAAGGRQLVVEDDGVGISAEKLEQLRSTPHYMMSDAATGEPRHGLGLLIVQQIARAHGGTVSFESGGDGGFRTLLSFPG